MGEDKKGLVEATSQALQDNLPETVKETDGILSTVVGFFNNVVLYPVKKANLTFKYKLEKFREDLETKTSKIPQENLQVPPTMIAGPVLEALKYTYDEEELREMYENLLTSAMDSRIAKQAHPSFVDAIKQMSPLDSRVLKEITTHQQFRCFEVLFTYNEQNAKRVYSYGMPNFFVEELEELGDPFEISTSIINLVRLGMIVITDGTIRGADYTSIHKNAFFQERLKAFNNYGKPISVEVKKHTIEINNYGHAFANVCIFKE